MLEKALNRFLISKKHGIDVKFVKIDPLIADILIFDHFRRPGGTFFCPKLTLNPLADDPRCLKML